MQVWRQFFQMFMQTSVAQAIRHSPHVANGRLNVANGFVTEYFTNKTFLDKIRYFQFKSHFSVKN